MRVLRRRPRSQSVPAAKMTLFEHLAELRDRIIKSVLALAVAFIAAVTVGYDPIFDVIKRPYCKLPPDLRGVDSAAEACKLVTLGVADPFLLRMRIALIVALVVAAPVWLYQLWAFITPGLHTREKRYAVPFMVSSTALFSLGAFFSYLTLDRGLEFLLGFGGDDINQLLAADRYLNFVVLMLVAFGVSFEFPLLLVFLELVGVVDASKLRRWRRGMYFGIAVFTAVITPSQDPITFGAMAIPMGFFYEGVVIFARIRERRRGRDTTSTDQWGDDETSPIGDEPPLIDA